MNNINGMPLVNIVAAEMITEQDSPVIMCFDTASVAEPKPFVSEGQEKELRVKNQILAQNCPEDIVKGYNIKLKDVVFRPELLALLDGGEVSELYAGNVRRYRAPIAGEVSDRTRFKLRLYTEEKSGSGEAVAYCRFTFPHCVGTPASFTMEDGSFVAPEYEIHSRPVMGESAMIIDCMSDMPTYISDATDLPANPGVGQEFIATQGISSVNGMTLKAGDSIYWNGVSYLRG